jgi:hypothetical protein
MAARIRKQHQDEVRARIQTSQLVNRLTDHALGKIELTNTQVRSIEILLKKSIPDLQSVELTGDPENPVHLVGMTKEQRDAAVAAATRADA